MSIMKKLSSAGDKVRELQSDFNSLKNYSHSGYGFDSNFSSLLMSVANFLSEVDKVYEAIDKAFDEIDRLNEEVDQLSKTIDEMEGMAE